MEIDELRRTLERIIGRLSSLNIRYHLTGGLAVSVHGEPRTTQDIDIVIKPAERREDIQRLIESFGNDYFLDIDNIRKEFIRQGLFQLIDKETYIKIDFHIGEAVPGELERSVIREFFPGLLTPFVSKEDAILSKLLWIKKGSHRSRKDVALMLRMPTPLDNDVLDQRARELGVFDLLQELRAQPEIL